MFGSYAFGAGYFGQGPDFETVIVAVEQRHRTEFIAAHWTRIPAAAAQWTRGEFRAAVTGRRVFPAADSEE